MRRRSSAVGVSKESPDWVSSWPEAREAVHRVVRGRLPVGVDPEDVSQQVAVRLLGAGEGAPPADRLSFWSIRVARNLVADLYRGKTLALSEIPFQPDSDVEAVVMTRLRCEAASEAYRSLSTADRVALADPARPDKPLSNSTKLRRGRARRVLRERAQRTVGGAALLPRLRWLVGSAGTAAALVPFCFGLPTPGGRPGVPQVEPPTGRDVARLGISSDLGFQSVQAPPRPAGAVARPAAADAGRKARRLWREAHVDVPGRGRAGYENHQPPPEGGDPPLVCLRNLRPADDVCVEHPLR